MDRKHDELLRQNSELDKHINSMKQYLEGLTKDPIYDEFAFVTYEDIQSLRAFSEDAQKSTIVAIRAPPGSNLEMPSFDEIEDLQNKINKRIENAQKKQ